MPLQTAAVLWRSLVLQCIKRHYIHSFLELLSVLLLSLAIVTTKFAGDPTFEPGRRQEVGAMTAWRMHRARQGHPKSGDDYANQPDWLFHQPPAVMHNVLEDGQGKQGPEKTTAAANGGTKKPKAVLFSPAIPKYDELLASAFPNKERRDYTSEPHLAHACSLTEFEACIHFVEGQDNELVYHLHYFESENPGEKGLDIGFRHPKEFYFQQDLDRPLWGAVYVAQTAINSAYIAATHRTSVNNITVKPFPRPAFPENIKRYRYGTFWLVATVFLYPTCRLLFRLCDENSSGLREYQLLMGLSNCFYWTGHFLCALCFLIVHSATCVYTTSVYKLFETEAPYLERTDPFLIFVAFFVLGTQQILLAMTISCLFTSPCAAVVCAVIVSVAVPFWVLDTLNALDTLAEFVFGSRSWMLLSSLMPTVAAYNVFTILGIQNDFDDGATWRKTLQITLGVVNVTVVDIWVVCCSVTLIMILLIGYLSNVLPWNTAIPLHPFFLLQPKYWLLNREYERHRTIVPAYYDPRFESAPYGAKLALHIQELSVFYGNNEALKDVTLQTYHKQATVLVGRNGAGKTTLLNVIAGLQQPTSGIVKIYGQEVTTRTNIARVYLSYCPQRDLFFPDLTVWEHLIYFGVLKRMPRASLRAAAEEALVTANLESCARTLATDLQRQQKKRLSIAIAIISKPMLVVLDEPTAALEPEHARNIWAALLKVRRDSGLLFSTHNMTEADVLADRVVALSAGIIVCNASPTHLKNLYGVGYKLNLAKSPAAPFHHRNVLSIVKKCAPEAEILRDSSTRAVIALHTVMTHGFHNMFRELESQSSHLGIKSIGLSVSTLKDIYLKMTLTSASLMERNMLGQQLPGNLSTLLSSRGEGTTAYGRAKVYMMERVLYMRTLWHSVLLSRVLPVFVIVMGLQSMALVAKPSHPPRNATASIIKVPVSLNPLYRRADIFLDDDAKARQGISPYYVFMVKQEGAALHHYNGTAADSLLLEAVQDYAEYTRHYVLGAVFRGEMFEAWFNPYAIMSKPIAFDLVSSALHAYRTGSYWARFNTTLMVHIPKGREVDSGLDDDLIGRVDTAIHTMMHIWALAGPLGVALVVCAFLAFPSAESCSGFMQLKLMTGISGWLHCFLNIVFDLATFIWIALPISVSFLLFYSLGRASLKALFMVFVVFGVLAILSALLIAYCTRSYRRAYATVMIIFGAFGTLAMEATVYMARRGQDVGFLCSVLAPCAMPMAVIKVIALEWTRKACFALSRRKLENSTALGAFCRKTADYHWIYQEDMFAGLLKTHVDLCCSANAPNPESWHALQMTSLGLGLELYFFIAECILLFMYLSCRNSGRFFQFASVGTPSYRQKAVDTEVVRERTAVHQAHQMQQYSRYALVAEDVHKWYGQEYAVCGFNLALPRDECLGLLGVYGCGKTSVAQMLAGLTIVSLGECRMDDAKLSDSPRAWQSHLGYCPEEDALMDVFTGYEVLELFARLRGVPEDKIEPLVECLAGITDLGDHYAKDFCGNYSAGSRRKLSVAVALIGLPRVIILDDATRGIDLGGREMIYEALRDITRVGASAIIMTSRSTEECEMACTRVSVMAGGEVKVLGSVARLKQLFATGFTLTLALAERATSYTIEAVDKGVITAFRDAKRADCREGVFVYYVTQSLPWSEVFTRIEQLRKWFWLESVLVADNSLDELFLGMGRAEMAEDGAVAKRAAKDASYPTYTGDPWGRQEQQKYELLKTVREARKKEKEDAKPLKEASPP